MENFKENILDGEEMLAHEYAMNSKKNNIMRGLVLFVVLTLISVLKPHFVPSFLYVGFSTILIIVVFICEIALKRKKFNTVYFFELENEVILNLYLVNSTGEKKIENYNLNSIKKAKILSWGHNKSGRLLLETFTKKLSFDVIGEKVIQELKPFFENK